MFNITCTLILRVVVKQVGIRFRNLGGVQYTPTAWVNNFAGVHWIQTIFVSEYFMTELGPEDRALSLIHECSHIKASLSDIKYGH